MLTDFINSHQCSKVEVIFNKRTYFADSVYVENKKQTIYCAGEENPIPINDYQEKIIHFTVERQLVDAILNYRANNGSNYPTIDIVITTINDRKVFIQEATLIEWSGIYMSAIVDKIKCLQENVYELATSSSIFERYRKAKLLKDAGIRRFVQILLDEEQFD